MQSYLAGLHFKILVYTLNTDFISFVIFKMLHVISLSKKKFSPPPAEIVPTPSQIPDYGTDHKSLINYKFSSEDETRLHL